MSNVCPLLVNICFDIIWFSFYHFCNSPNFEFGLIFRSKKNKTHVAVISIGENTKIRIASSEGIAAYIRCRLMIWLSPKREESGKELSAAFTELRFSPIFLRKLAQFSRTLGKRIIRDCGINQATCYLDKNADLGFFRTLQTDTHSSFRCNKYFGERICNDLPNSPVSNAQFDISLSYGVSPFIIGIILGELDKYEKQWLEAKNQLVEANLRLVIYLAKQYRSSQLELADLIQEGNIGLLKAVDKFDYRLGYRFSTYAAFWIRQIQAQALNKLRKRYTPILQNFL